MKYQFLGTTTDRVNWIDGTTQKSDQAEANQTAIALVKVTGWQEGDRAAILAKLEGNVAPGTASAAGQLAGHLVDALTDGVIDPAERQQLLQDILGHDQAAGILGQAAQALLGLLGKK